MSRRRSILLGAGALGLLLWGAACEPLLTDKGGPVPTNFPTPTVSEDSPGWECARMGNKICGPVRVAVGPDGSVRIRARAGLTVDLPAGSVGYGGTVSGIVGALSDCSATVPDAVVLAAEGVWAVKADTRAVLIDGNGCLVAVGEVENM